MKVLITGARGRIGRVLTCGLDHDVTEFDLPEHDARSLDQLTDAATGHDAIVHLAWNTAAENFRTDDIDFDNAMMSFNAYRACALAGVRRLVVASSVHADDQHRRREGLLVASALSTPDSPYGASKLFVEALGRYFAGRVLEVVVVRFGGVDRHATSRDFGNGCSLYASWLSHADCAGLIDACLVAATVPARSAAVYAVSDNQGRVHDTTNPFGWVPEPR